MLNNNATFVVGCSVFFLLCLSAYRSRTLRPPLPPAPPSRLFCGHVHQLPKFDHWLTYTRWAEKYGESLLSQSTGCLLNVLQCATGPIFYFRTYFQGYVVLNSAKVVTDLLEARSTIFSDRPIVSSAALHVLKYVVLS